jgi:Ca2+/H+ antiporter
MKGKMELTIGVSVGSSIQIAAGMIPILTLLAWPMGVGRSIRQRYQKLTKRLILAETFDPVLCRL